MKYPAIWLRREGTEGEGDAVVLIEVGGNWVEIIREPAGSCFSHCVHDGGIKRRVEESADLIATNDLVASGGIFHCSAEANETTTAVLSKLRIAEERADALEVDNGIVRGERDDFKKYIANCAKMIPGDGLLAVKIERLSVSEEGGEAALTEEYLRSVGFESDDELGGLFIIGHNSQPLIFYPSVCEWEWGDSEVPSPTTIADFHRLAAGLGIVVGETAKETRSSLCMKCGKSATFTKIPNQIDWWQCECGHKTEF